MSTIYADVRNSTEEFSKEVQHALSSDQAYEQQSKMLSVVATVASASTEVTELMSVDFDTLKEQARQGVRIHSDRIEASLLETTDWELVQVELEKLEESKLLDEYTSSEGSTRFTSLQTLLEQKQTTVDSIVETYIQENNYKGLREFLIPSAGTKDQIKRQKFKLSLTRITSSLSMIVDDVGRRLQFLSPTDEQLQIVSKGVNAIREANTELGDFLSSVDKKLLLPENIMIIEQETKKKTMKFGEKIHLFAASNDFVSLGTNHSYANAFERHLHSCLTVQTRRAVEKARVAFRESMKQCDADVKEFAGTWFKNTKLLRHLNSLKEASEQKSPELPELVVVYHDSKELLVRSLQEAMASIKGIVSQRYCFHDAVRALGDLENALETGLEVHVTSTELLSDIRSHRIMWENARQETERSHFKQITSEKTIVSWKKRLESLDPRTWGSAARGTLYGDSFNNYRRKVTARVKEKVSSGTAAMQNRDYLAVNQIILSLEIMECHLSEYIPSVRETSGQMKERAFKLFRELCAQIKQVLLCDSRRREFQGFYENYRRLVCAIPCVVHAENN